MVCPLLPEKCASKIVVFPFGWIGDDHGVKRVKIKVYVANYMYMYNLRQEVSICNFYIKLSIEQNHDLKSIYDI